MVFEALSNLLDPNAVFLALVAMATFFTVVTLAMPLFERDRVAKRMKAMATERDRMRAERLAELNAESRRGQLRQKPKGFMQQIVDTLNLSSLLETEDIKDKLKMAGFRGQNPLVVFLFFRFALPIVMFVGALVYLFVFRGNDIPPIIKLGISLLAAYVGLYLPNIFLTNLIQKRQESIAKAFPDALDLLLICVQSGMSIEAAFGKISQEVADQSVPLAEELSLATAELSYLQDRRQAYENLAKRTGIAAVKATCTSLIQAERYGTPIGQALRVMAKENRDMRMAEAEKKAAALPPKLTVPMIVFFLPVLFVVIIGPAIVRVMRLRGGG